jgi:hypothetical protein
LGGPHSGLKGFGQEKGKLKLRNKQEQNIDNYDLKKK